RYSGAGVSVSRERLSIAAVERGSFVRDVAADGQVVAAVSPTLYAAVAGTANLQEHRRRHSDPRPGTGAHRQPRFDRKAFAGGRDPAGPQHRLAPCAPGCGSQTP